MQVGLKLNADGIDGGEGRSCTLFTIKNHKGIDRLDCLFVALLPMVGS